ncbi:MAG: hypothetical protein COA78_06640 [Blastopirellula sp.]|nr:MAG: hypothetical protein COA78_06640 [Blastopirellula sp.]
MNDKQDLPELTEFLRAQGHTTEEIERIINKIHEHDLGSMIDSIMDSIDSGEFDIQKIIREALKDD